MTDPIDLEALRGVLRVLRAARRAPATNSDVAAAFDAVAKALAELTTRRSRDAEVAELVAAQRSSIDEIERLRDAMFRVYATAANGGNVTPWIEKMRDEMEKPWSVGRSRAALLPFQRSDDKGDAT